MTVLELPRPRTAADMAGAVAAALIACAGPVTPVLEALLPGREIILRPAGPHVRDADPAERELLRLPAGGRLYVREGYWMAGTVVAARTTLRLATDRIPAAAFAAIRSGTPAGTVLGPLGLARPRREVRIEPGGPWPVRAGAVLWLRAVPIGTGAEEIPDSLLALLARC